MRQWQFAETNAYYEELEEIIMYRFATETVQLTDRETEVLGFIALGLSAKEVALKLSISPCTVERHIENARLKTRTRNRTHMIAYTLRRGMLP
ncbi:helix-turn-helix transcriptional regulator [Sphingobium sp. TB-6]|uniref:response regulator transcription factor n=2 Tax=unclassified Sphingobium TaxID=2611147 RepID=UPI001123AD48|nr:MULTISPECIES: helix-turn-helix transcriptional regulator [Sphingomonadaceae]